jgi:serine/threonine protein kinase/WD40 repeat protein/tetratricopeptide (TPR) repeat protein
MGSFMDKLPADPIDGTGNRDYGRFDELAEEFAERYRRGERPSLDEYVERLPEMADEIREMFPALVEVEQVDEGRAEQEKEAKAARPAKALQQIGDYRILGQIGRGGMGVVYEAEQVSLGRRVALKVLPRHVASDRTTLERFRREARAAARLHHTNIVPVFEVGSDGDVRFYAMQFIQGQSLDAVIAELRHLRIQSHSRGSGEEKAIAGGDTQTMAPSVAHSILAGGFLPEAQGRASSAILRQHTVAEPAGAALALAKAAVVDQDATLAGPPPEFAPDSSSSPTPLSWAVLPGGTQLSVAEMSHRVFHRSVAHIGRQAAGALAHAHARGVIHRDVKPSNLLLDVDGVVWVTDFGLAKADDDGLTQSGDVLGTIRYMAPERFRGQADARSDVYALGLTLYELLILRPAFDSPNRLALIDLVKNVDPPHPRSIDPRIPLDLETIVLKAVEKDPKARYASADALAEDLRRFLADEPIRARQISAPERYWRWARRNPVIATMGGVLTALLVAVTLGSMGVAAYFKESARRETNLAAREQRANQQSQRDRKDAIEARRIAIGERDRSLRLSSGLALDKGIALAQEGHAERGLLWMLEALKTAPDDAGAFRKLVRWNLGAWLGQVHRTLGIFDARGVEGDLAFSPDGKVFAAGFNPLDRSLATPIDLWETASGRKLATLDGAFAPFAFRPDGKVLVVHDDERRVVAIDLLTRRAIWKTPQLPGAHGYGEITFCSDARTLFVTCWETRDRGSIRRLDASTGKQLGEPVAGTGWATAAPDGTSVATRRVENGKAYIDVFDVPSGRRSASWQTAGSQLYSLLFGPDGRSLFVAAPKGGVLNQQNSYVGRVWDAHTGQPVSPPMPSTRHAGFSPSADLLVTLTQNFTVVRDARSGVMRGSGSFSGDADRFALHPDGRTVLSPLGDGVLHLWQISPDSEPLSNGEADTDTSTTPSESGRPMRALTLFWSGLWTDGRIAFSPAESPGGRELIRLSDPATGRTTGSPASHHPGWKVRALALSPDGRCFATGSHPNNYPTGEVRVWDSSTGRLRFPPLPHTNYVKALAFHPDGKVLAVGDFNGLVRLWDPESGREIGRPLAQGEIVMALTYSPDGTILAVGLANDHTRKAGVRLWDTRTGQPIGELLPTPRRVSRIEFAPDGRTLLADTEGPSTRLWDVTRGQAISESFEGELGGGFRPDGRAFLTAGNDGTVKLRDSASGSVLAVLLSNTSPATSAAFRGDGGLVVAGFADSTVRLCDPATAQPVGPPRTMRHAVHQVSFASDGHSVVAIDALSESRTWPVAEPLGAESLKNLSLRLEARTGLRMETGGVISPLPAPAWRDRLERLAKLDPAAVQGEGDLAWHVPRIRDAEHSGNTFAALWHLDRLIAARPDDWYLYARRAKALSFSDKPDRFDKAAADFEQAIRLGAPDQVLDFQAHCVVDCTESGRWDEALWYLDRLIATREGDVTMRAERAAVYGKLGRETDRQAELARVFELGADEGMVIPRARELGQAGRWSEAATLLARCGRAGPLSRDLAQAWAVACLNAGDRSGYREACAADLAVNGPNPTVVWNELAAATVIAMGAGGLDDYQVPIAWLERRLSASPAPRPLYRHYLSNALGGLLLRAGRLDEAILRLDDAIAAAKETKDGESPGDWAYLAVAHARKGQFAEARAWLDRLRSLHLDPRGAFWDVHELALLQAEAESIILDAEFPGDPFP